jgi:hypothetical protein
MAVGSTRVWRFSDAVAWENQDDSSSMNRADGPSYAKKDHFTGLTRNSRRETLH